MDEAFKRKIEQEYRALLRDESVIHNRILHNSILETWKQGSPKMWANLQREKMADKLAYVLQQRMWERRDELVRAGMPITDAREMAEQEELMLEPEAQGDVMEADPLSE